MGSSTQKTTSTSSTAPANPAVTATQTKLLTGLGQAFDRGVEPFPKSTYPGAGQTTQNAWQETLGAAGNQDYAKGIGGAISDFGDIASGKRFGMNDPGYATLRQNAINDTLQSTNAAFDGSGLFGADSNRRAAGEGVGNAVAGMDYANYMNDIARQQQAAGMLPGMFTASLAPSAARGAVGSAQDADALAARQAEADLFDRTKNANWNTLGRASSILSGTAGVGGTNTTNTQTSPTTPWWQSAIGLGIGLL